MITKGIRGAISVDENSAQAIESAVKELLGELISQNSVEKKAISHVIFTLTKDLNAEFPAKCARTLFGWDDVAMLCFNELDVPNALEKCLRVLVVVNCEDDFSPNPIYLGAAKKLRPDFSK